MIAVDTNVLIYAHREEFPQHAAAVARITALAEGTVPWAIPIFCLGEFIRVVTHRRVLTPPSSVEQAVGFLDALSASDSIRVLLPDAAYWAELRSIVVTRRVTGNLAFDAQIAALCRSYGAVLLTNDRDFAGLDVQTLAL